MKTITVAIVLLGLSALASTTKVYYCPVPSIPFHSKYPPNYYFRGFPLGSILSFYCHPGFVLVGSSKSRCDIYLRRWHPALPKCIKKITYCPARPTPRGLSVNPDKPKYSPGDDIKFTCDYKGYVLVGKDYDECLDNGKWKINMTPTCKRVTCPRRLNPRNGNVSPVLKDYFPGIVITFSCIDGYKLHGAEKDECQDNGKWKINNTPKCLPIPKCPKRNAPANGYVNPGPDYFPGDTITFTCGKKFVLRGFAKDLCQGNGKWKVNRTPKCVKLCFISVSNPYLTYKPVKKAYEPDDEVHFKCKDGFHLIGDDEFECQDDGTWDPEEFPGCVRRCYPPDIDNGGVKDEKKYYLAGAFIEYFCNTGYSISVTTSGRCLASGKWDKIAVCKPIIKKCKAPTISNGGVNPTQTWFNSGDTITYYCAYGYKLKGKYTKNICKSTGSWAYPIPVCEEIPPVKATCRGRCYKFDYGKPCQCHHLCKKFYNCCKDYDHYCGGYKPLFSY